MNTILKCCTVLIIILTILGGCGFSTAQEEEIVETATTVSIKYIETHYNTDFVLKNYTIEENSVFARVHLYGYIKGNDTDLIRISYDLDSKEIVNVTGPDWFIDSRNPKKNSEY
ncbi:MULTISPECIES: hypothetical protein [Paenibacillus]|uniref:hypothetical protein n=1 Tax=Paenibacillus TaxID=44249 RepID=UPI001C65468A|nr:MULTISPECIES: hypothetical protein [Paenibacillus]QYK69857.1 hypothetical protein KAI36_05065 [Paenibacillus sp. S02]